MEDQERLSKETRMSVFRHSILTYTGLICAVIGAAGGIITFTINFANKSDKSLIETPNEPLGTVVPGVPISFFLDYRYILLVIFLIAILTSLLLYHVNAKRKLYSLQLLDQFMVEYVTVMAEIQWFAERRGPSLKDNLNEIHNATGIFLKDSLNRISLLFTRYTGSVCHTSIKLYDSSDNTVETVARDNLSTPDRWVVDRSLKRQDVASNTAFESILGNEKVNSFCCNHLRVRAFIGRYQNQNPEWRNLYHACMIVPLTHETSSSQITKDTVWGFLMVDNLGGGFAAEPVRDPASCGQLRRIVCVTHSRFTCWNPAPICGQSNYCSATTISRLRQSICVSRPARSAPPQVHWTRCK